MKPARYVCGHHAAQRYQQRTGTKLSLYHTSKEVEWRASHGTIIDETPTRRLVFHNGLYFPCVFRNDNIYMIKTVLTEDMLEGHRETMYS